MDGHEGEMTEDRRITRSWILYDWANSAFATTVLAGFFPLFYKSYWAGHLEGTRSTALLGTAASVSVVLVLLVAVGLGALADRTGTRRLHLAFFCVLGSLSTMALALVPEGWSTLALAVYVTGTLGFAGGNVFYDALLPIVAPSRRLDDVSARGFALGYAGGGLLFAAQVGLFLVLGSTPEGKVIAVKASFVVTGLWWAVFAIPLLVTLKEPRARPAGGAGAEIVASFRRLAGTFREMRGHRDLFLFLLAFWFYSDGVNTVIKMATAYGMDIGLASAHMMGALLLVQFIGLPSAWAYGILARRVGRKPMILAAIVAYAAVVLFAYFMSTAWHFFLLAAVVGLFQGGIQAISRSLYADLVPPGRSAEFFGFYNLSAKFSTVAGPVVVGWIGGLTANPRTGILSLVPFFVVGAVLLVLVDTTGGRRQASG